MAGNRRENAFLNTRALLDACPQGSLSVSPLQFVYSRNTANADNKNEIRLPLPEKKKGSTL